MPGNEFDPIANAVIAERLHSSITNLKEAFVEMRETQRDFAEGVLEKLSRFGTDAALNDSARIRLSELEKDLQKLEREFVDTRSTFKAWLAIALMLSGAVGGGIGNYVANHLK